MFLFPTDVMMDWPGIGLLAILFSPPCLFLCGLILLVLFNTFFPHTRFNTTSDSHFHTKPQNCLCSVRSWCWFPKHHVRHKLKLSPVSFGSVYFPFYFLPFPKAMHFFFILCLLLWLSLVLSDKICWCRFFLKKEQSPNEVRASIRKHVKSSTWDFGSPKQCKKATFHPKYYYYIIESCEKKTMSLIFSSLTNRFRYGGYFVGESVFFQSSSFCCFG